MSAPSKRLVLVKPGDVLFIGNVGELDDVNASVVSEALIDLKNILGLSRVILFEADIDIDTSSDGKGA